MKIILSRKGFDSGYGGYPSPILPNGELISLPIPDFSRDITYDDLHTSAGQPYSGLMKKLFGSTIRFENNGRVEIGDIGCHFDPDLRSDVYKRKKDWQPIFGQAGSSQSHLRNQGVGIGDIFLYFGWFRDTEDNDNDLCYSKLDKKGKHIIYGYLQVGEMHQINSMKRSDWMMDHPHVRRGHTAKDNDFLYVASPTLSFNPSLPGAGVLKYSKDIVLTKDGMSRTKWLLPDIFKGTTISYHSLKSWKEGYFQSAAKGQEFVIDATDEIREWAEKLINMNNGVLRDMK